MKEYPRLKWLIKKETAENLHNYTTRKGRKNIKKMKIMIKFHHEFLKNQPSHCFCETKYRNSEKWLPTSIRA